jgi:DUF1680 family protein
MAPNQAPQRRKWFHCACCPPNLARLLTSLGGYVYGQAPGETFVHLYVGGRATLDVAGTRVVIEQKTAYPWRETVRLRLRPERPAAFTLSLRVPGWCRGAALRVNGKTVRLSGITKKGYARVRRTWQRGDSVELTLPMPVERVQANPRVRMNAGRVALQRGPVVYCIEEADNGRLLDDIVLPEDAPLRVRMEKKVLGGVPVITTKAWRGDGAWRDTLYRPIAGKRKRVTIRAIPYARWANRGPGEMLVWIRSAP